MSVYVCVSAQMIAFIPLIFPKNISVYDYNMKF